ncbi:MAG: glutaminyl-peptide cyclotransferase [Polyangiales bacterium]|nr:glutaminyl-peptide cyclotransferase [Myxococcales bacterium]
MATKKTKRKTGRSRGESSGRGSAASSRNSFPWGYVGAVGLIVIAIVAWSLWEPEYAHSVVPKKLNIEVVATYPHSTEAWTQGLLWHGGKVIEGTGLEGKSSLRRVELKTGTPEHQIALPKDVFAEGVALVGDRLLQLTWKDHRAFAWSADTFKPLGEFKYDGEGWGLCYDGKRLVMSDGSERLAFRDPKTFRETGSVYVHYAGERFHGKLNELECVGKYVYANVWTNDEDRIVQIDPGTGDVVAWVDAQGLLPEETRRHLDVLNGIAYVPERQTFLITGKMWPKMFEVRFVPAH